MQKRPIFYDPSPPPKKKHEAKTRSKKSTGPERNKTIKKSSYRHKKVKRACEFIPLPLFSMVHKSRINKPLKPDRKKAFLSFACRLIKFVNKTLLSHLSVSCSTPFCCLHLQAGTGADAIFTAAVPSPLDDERRSIVVTFFLRQSNENRLNHGQNLKIINLRDQASHDSGN